MGVGHTFKQESEVVSETELTAGHPLSTYSQMNNKINKNNDVEIKSQLQEKTAY